MISKIAFRNLFRQRMRTGMTVCSIVFGVVALILSGGFVDDIFVQLRDATIHSRLGFIQVYKNGYYELGRRHPNQYLVSPDEPLLDKLWSHEESVDVFSRIGFAAMLNNTRVDYSIQVEGIEADKEAELNTFLSIIDGRALASTDNAGISIGEGVAQALNLKAGDFVTVVTNTVDGALNTLEVEVVGVYRTFSKDYDSRSARITLAAAQELLSTNAVHSFVYSLTGHQAVDDVAQHLRRTLGDEFEVFTWLQLDEFYRKTVAMYRRQFGVLQLIILGIVLLSVSSSINMTLQERIGEFGTLRALGQRSGYVYRLILFEYCVLGFIASLIGVALGVGLALLISKVGIPMPPPPNANAGYMARIQIEPWSVGFAFAIGFFATAVSALFSGVGPSRKDIAEALRANI